MKIFITGALGHIGSLLIREIAKEMPGAQMVLLDNLSCQRYCSLFDLPRSGSYLFKEGDILKDDLREYIKEADAVIHLAAITNAAASFDNKDEVEAANYDGTIRVAELCTELRVPFLFISTTSVYGTQEEMVDENCSIDELKPQSPYADSKLRAEMALKEMGKRGLPFVTLRFGTIFGISPGMRFHTAINKFCWQALNGQPITVWKTALHQKRPYLDLKDGVRALIYLMKNRKIDGETYNVLTANSSVFEITEVIRKYIPDLRIEYVDSKIMNQLSYHVRNEKFQKLGFEFQGDLEQGIFETIRLLAQVRSGAVQI